MPSSFIKDGLYYGHMHEESKSVIFAEYRPWCKSRSQGLWITALVSTAKQKNTSSEIQNSCRIWANCTYFSFCIKGLFSSAHCVGLNTGLKQSKYLWVGFMAKMGAFFEAADFSDQHLRITRLQRDLSLWAALYGFPSSPLHITLINSIWKKLPGYHRVGWHIGTEILLTTDAMLFS